MLLFFFWRSYVKQRQLLQRNLSRYRCPSLPIMTAQQFLENFNRLTAFSMQRPWNFTTMDATLKTWMIGKLLNTIADATMATTWNHFCTNQIKFVNKFMIYHQDDLCRFVNECVAKNPAHPFVNTQLIQDWLGEQIRKGTIANERFVTERATSQHKATIVQYTNWLKHENARYNPSTPLGDFTITYNAPLIAWMSKENKLWYSITQSPHEPTSLDYKVRKLCRHDMYKLKELVAVYREHLLHVWYAKLWKLTKLFQSEKSFVNDKWFKQHGIPFVETNLTKSTQSHGIDELYSVWNDFFDEKYADKYHLHASFQSLQDATVYLDDSDDAPSADDESGDESDDEAPLVPPNAASAKAVATKAAPPKAALPKTAPIGSSHGVKFTQMSSAHVSTPSIQKKPTKRKASHQTSTQGKRRRWWCWLPQQLCWHVDFFM